MRDFSIPVPDLAHIWALAVSLMLFGIFAGAGAAVRGRSGIGGVDVLVGYGAVSGAIIWLGMLPIPIPIPLSAGALGIVAAAASCSLLARSNLHLLAPLARCLALSLPLLVTAVALRPVQWDDYSHWIPNAAYLYQYDSLPRADLPASTSQWPAYPYAMPIWTWLVSLGSGFFVENAGRIASGLFLVAAAALLLEVVRQEARLQALSRWREWGAAAISVLAVTALSPSFHRGHTLTGYADTATSVAVAGLGWVGSRFHQEPWREGGAAPSLLQFSVLAVLLVSLKQVNVVLLALLCAGLFTTIWLDARGHRLRRAGWLCVAVLPALAQWFLWHRYAGTHIPGGDIRWLAVEEWRWGMTSVIASAMTAQALRIPVHFIVMFAAIWLGMRALFHRPEGSIDALAILTAVTFIGYTLFLFIIYVGANFSEPEVARAASFHRYSTHVGILGLLTLGAASSRLLAWHARDEETPRMKAATIGLILAAALSVPVGWRHFIGAHREVVVQAEKLSRDLQAELPPGMTLELVAPRDDGFLRTALQYAFSRPAPKPRAAPKPRDLRVSARVHRWHPDPVRGAQDVADDASIDHVVLYDAPKEVSAVFGLQGQVDGPVWLARTRTGWRLRQLGTASGAV